MREGTARRLGGEDVKVIVRSPFDEMKASPWEKEDAMHEGIPILNFMVPKSFQITNGKLSGMTFEKVKAVREAFMKAAGAHAAEWKVRSPIAQATRIAAPVLVVQTDEAAVPDPAPAEEFAARRSDAKLFVESRLNGREAAPIRRRRPDADPATLVARGWDGARRMIGDYVQAGLSKFVVRPVATPTPEPTPEPTPAPTPRAIGKAEIRFSGAYAAHYVAKVYDLDAEALIRQAVDVVQAAKPMPLSASVLVSREELLDVLDAAVAQLPEEIRQARWLLREREEFMAEQRREAEEARELKVREEMARKAAEAAAVCGNTSS